MMEARGPARARAGRYDSTRPPTAPPEHAPSRAVPRGRTCSPRDHPTRPPGRRSSRVARSTDIVRTATLGSYGVTGFAGGPLARLVVARASVQPGLVIRTDDGIEIELDLTVALGVPVAEVARQVDSAVATPCAGPSGGRSPASPSTSTGCASTRGDAAGAGRAPTAIRPRDLADSGTDVA